MINRCGSAEDGASWNISWIRHVSCLPTPGPFTLSQFGDGKGVVGLRVTSKSPVPTKDVKALVDGNNGRFNPPQSRFTLKFCIPPFKIAEVDYN